MNGCGLEWVQRTHISVLFFLPASEHAYDLAVNAHYLLGGRQLHKQTYSALLNFKRCSVETKVCWGGSVTGKCRLLALFPLLASAHVNAECCCSMCLCKTLLICLRSITQLLFIFLWESDLNQLRNNM